MKFEMRFIGLCVLCVLGLAGCSRTEKIAPREVVFADEGAGMVGVMTFNIRYGSADDGENSWDRRKELVFDVLAGYAADVIGMQEVLDFQLKEIKRALPQYKAVSVGRDDGKRAGEACSILYRGDRFILADSGTFWFSNMPWKPGSRHWGNEVTRICTWVRLTEVATDESFYVYNLHLDHKSQNSRLYSMQLLAKEIAKREHPDPVIVLGDFNMDTENPALAAFVASGTEPRCIDVWRHLHPDQPRITTYHAFGKQSGGPCVDHILIDETIEIIEVAIDARCVGGRYPSDHFPIIARLKVYDADRAGKKNPPVAGRRK